MSGFNNCFLDMGLNKLYTEERLGDFAQDVGYNLALQLSPSGNSIPHDNIRISSDGIIYDAFEKDELNTVRSAILLLMVAISDYDTTILGEKGVVKVPDSMILTETSLNEGGDLLGHIPLTEKGYCLFLAYQKLVVKLSDRNTPLFRVLFICVCLEAWRQGIPPRMIVGIAGNEVHWGDLILQLTHGFSSTARINLALAGYAHFVQVLEAAVQKVSEAEIPENILRHYYPQGQSGSQENISLVSQYIHTIIRESNQK